MSCIRNAFDGLNQIVNMVLCIAGFCLGVGGLIYSIVVGMEQFVSGSFGYFAIYSGKSIYEYGYSMVRLGQEVKKLTSENLRLEQTVDRAEELCDNYKTHNEELGRNINTLKSTNGELKATSAQLQNSLNTANSNLLAGEKQIKLMSEQISDMNKLLENSKKMVTNLILAGDDYHKFNEKFGTNLSSLDETAKDLKKYTEFLGTITNSLATHVSESRIQDVCVDMGCVGNNAKKSHKIGQILEKKKYAIDIMGRLPASSARSSALVGKKF